MSEEQTPQEQNSLLPQEEDATTQPQESTTLIQSNTLAPKPESLTMEVHHHGHVHEQKKWKAYLFQFFMLFLAVFCGFLAEYTLEHRIENDRERQFMASMINDLKSDKILLDENINLRMNREKLLDSFIMLLRNDNFPEYGNDIYYAGRILTLPILFTPNDRTIQQLKFSGALRLVRNAKVSDSIMAYYQQMERLAFAAEDEQTIRAEFRNYAGKIFDGRVFFDLQDKNSGINIARPSGNPQLIKTDPASINELIVRAQYISSVQRSIRYREERIEKISIGLMDFIAKEYDLEMNK